MQILLTVCLPREEASVPLIRHIVRDSLLKIGATADCVGDIELALTEACANVLHHVRDNPKGYQVDISIEDRACDIRVSDDGAGFDGGPLAEASETSESGRGISLMRALMDDLQFVKDKAGGTVVHLAKRLELVEDSLMIKLSPAKVLPS
jgi:serine/threonine-protein kinase RsbW